jgi:hypothetical protein
MSLLLMISALSWSVCAEGFDRSGGECRSVLYRLDETLPSHFREAVQAALTAWSERLPITVSECINPQRQRCVMFRLVEAIHGDAAPFILNRSLAHTVVRGPYPVEVHFNKELLTDNGVSKGDVYQTALHEVGHVIGIPHSTDEQSIMYPIRIRTLRQDVLPGDVEACHAAAAISEQSTR